MNPWITGRIIEQMQTRERDGERPPPCTVTRSPTRQLATETPRAAAGRHRARDRPGGAAHRRARVPRHVQSTDLRPAKLEATLEQPVDDVRRDFDIHPLTPDRWADLERLFGERGASSGCWCMWWRIPAKDWEATGRRRKPFALRRVVKTGPAPGLLALPRRSTCRLGRGRTRSEYPRLNRSTKLKPVDDLPAWSVTCFYIDRMYRGTGVAGTLLAAAVDHARTSGPRWSRATPSTPERVA